MKSVWFVAATAVSACASAGSAPTEAPANEAERMARAVKEAAGNPYSVAAIRFRFVVESEGIVKLDRAHVWCPQAGVASVTVEGVTTTIDLFGEHEAPIEQDAYAAWVNDTYWLFAPAKLLDPGVQREITRDGELHVWFETVGLTPGDQYWFTIDPDTKLVSEWRYSLQGGRDGGATWERYESVGPLQIPTVHQAPNGLAIRHPDSEVLSSCPL